MSLFELKRQNFDPRRRFTHKYAVFGHNVECHGSCASAACATEAAALGLCGPVAENTTGMAELMGNDLIISLGGQMLSDGSGFSEPLATEYRDQLTRVQAGTFMHELGHNFGLDHGGAFDPSAACAPGQNTINRKPNYISVMNYSMQFTGILTAAANCSTVPILPNPPYAQFPPVGEWRVDYSSSALADLDESALIESNGISTCTCGLADGLRDISLAFSNCSGVPAPIPGCGPVDWNRDGLLGTVSVDINQDPNLVCPHLETLSGFDDWTFLKTHMGFQCGTNFVDGSAFH